jgi:hypothetical protein
MSRARKKQAASSARPGPAYSQDEVSREAFRIYQARHGAPGDPVRDWCEAERIVIARAAANASRAAQVEATAGSNGPRRRGSSRRRK